MSISDVVDQCSMTGGAVTNIRISNGGITPLCRGSEVVDTCITGYLDMALQAIPLHHKGDHTAGS